jgi:hypothetical protein
MPPKIPLGRKMINHPQQAVDQIIPVDRLGPKTDTQDFREQDGDESVDKRDLSLRPEWLDTSRPRRSLKLISED